MLRTPKGRQFFLLSEIEQGKVYVDHSGIVELYMGKSEYGELYFYVLGAVDLVSNSNAFVFRHEKYFKPMFLQCAKTILTSVLDPTSVKMLSTLPKLECEITDLNMGNNFNTWYTKSVILGGLNLPVLHGKTEKVNSPYVKVRDLVPGKVYRSGNDLNWYDNYIYVGRDKWDNGFLWVYVSNERVLRTDPALFMSTYARLTKTKSCKKLREDVNWANFLVSEDLIPFGGVAFK